MRVSDSLIFGSAALNSNSALEAEQTASEVASTGLAVKAPGDNPAAASQIVADNVAQARYTAIGTAAQAASDELSSASSALWTCDAAHPGPRESRSSSRTPATRRRRWPWAPSR